MTRPSPAPRHRLLWHTGLAVLLALFSIAGCENEPVEESPERVVAEFVLRMRSVHGEAGAARAAHDLLWSEAKSNLAERAKRASAVSDHKVAPEDMIAPSHFSLRFEPKHFTAHTESTWSVVTVTGEQPTDRADIKCVQEDGRWRVALAIPLPPPIGRRPDSAE